MNREQYNWNYVYKMVMQTKDTYNDYYKDGLLNLERWIEKLNIPEINDFFDCIQMKQYDDLVLISYNLYDFYYNIPTTEKNFCYKYEIVIDIKNECIVIAPVKTLLNIDIIKDESIIIEDVGQNEMLRNALDLNLKCVRYYKHDIIAFDIKELNRVNINEDYKILTNNHKEMIIKNQTLTFLFKQVSLKKDFNSCNDTNTQKELYLVGVTNTYNGYEYSYSEVKRIGDRFRIPTVPIHNEFPGIS